MKTPDGESGTVYDVYRRIIQQAAIFPLREKLISAVLAVPWHYDFTEAATPEMQRCLSEVLYPRLIRTFVSDAFAVADYGTAMFEIVWQRAPSRRYVVEALDCLKLEDFELLKYESGDGFAGLQPKRAPANVLRLDKSICLALPRPGEPESVITWGVGLPERVRVVQQRVSKTDAELRVAYLGCKDEAEGITVESRRILRACERGLAQLVPQILRLNFGDDAATLASLVPEIPKATDEKGSKGENSAVGRPNWEPIGDTLKRFDAKPGEAVYKALHGIMSYHNVPKKRIGQGKGRAWFPVAEATSALRAAGRLLERRSGEATAPEPSHSAPPILPAAPLAPKDDVEEILQQNYGRAKEKTQARRNKPGSTLK